MEKTVQTARGPANLDLGLVVLGHSGDQLDAMLITTPARILVGGTAG